MRLDEEEDNEDGGDEEEDNEDGGDDDNVWKGSINALIPASPT